MSPKFWLMWVIIPIVLIIVTWIFIEEFVFVYEATNFSPQGENDWRLTLIKIGIMAFCVYAWILIYYFTGY